MKIFMENLYWILKAFQFLITQSLFANQNADVSKRK